MKNKEKHLESIEKAEEVRSACIQAAKESFHQASMSGLCMEGVIEAAIGAMQSLNLEEIIGRND